MMRLQTSPWNMRQEQLRDDPWKMLIVCFMLNQTNYKQVDKVKDKFFEKFPNAQSVIDANEEDIVSVIKPLGLYNRRAKNWKIFCQQWLEVTKQYGPRSISVEALATMKCVGRYALDSWKVFQLYQYDTQVNDHALNWYVDWARKEMEKIHAISAQRWLYR